MPACAAKQLTGAVKSVTSYLGFFWFLVFQIYAFRNGLHYGIAFLGLVTAKS